MYINMNMHMNMNSNMYIHTYIRVYKSVYEYLYVNVYRPLGDMNKSTKLKSQMSPDLLAIQPVPRTNV